jgi:hypothetical protein
MVAVKEASPNGIVGRNMDRADARGGSSDNGDSDLSLSISCYTAPQFDACSSGSLRLNMRTILANIRSETDA